MINIKKSVLVIILFFILAISSAVGSCTSDKYSYPDQISFETLAKSQNSGIDDRKNIVIRNNDELEEFLKDAEAINIDGYNIDFEKEMVIVVCMGQKNTAGYDIEIESITESREEISISVNLSKPGEDEITAQMLTTPFHMIKVKKIQKEINFKEI